MICNECGSLNKKDSNYCSVCGKSLVQEEVCLECSSPLTDNDRFCDKCGMKNPNYYGAPIQNTKAINIYEKTKVKPPIIRAKMNNRTIINIVILVTTIIGLIFSFTSISRFTRFSWDYANDEYEYVQYTYDQSTSNFYTGYFSSIFQEYDIALENAIEEYESGSMFLSETARWDADDYTGIWESINEYAISYYIGDEMLPSTMFYAGMNVITLFAMQVLLLVVIIKLILWFINTNTKLNISKLLLLASSLGIFLSFTLYKLNTSEIRPGLGLLMAITFSLLGFLIILINKVLIQLKTDNISKYQLIKYFTGVILTFLFLFSLTGGLVHVGYEYRTGSTSYGSIKLSEFNYFTEIHRDGYELLEDEDFLQYYESDFEDEDLSTTNVINLSKIYPYEIIFENNILEDELLQKFILAFTQVVTIAIFTTSCFYTMVVLLDVRGDKSRKKIIIGGILITLAVVLLLLGLLLVSRFNYETLNQSTLFEAKLGLSLFISIGLIVAHIIFDLVYKEKRNYN